MNFSRFRRSGALLASLVLALGALVSGTAHAQLTVTLTTPKRVFLAYEPIPTTIEVFNRTGKDIVLGDHDGQSWLAFDVATIGGDALLAYGGEPRFEPRVVPAGQSVRQTLSLGRHYAMGSQGNYAVKARAWFSETRQSFASNTIALTVAEGNEFYKPQPSGIPTGRSGPDSTVYRQFSLISFQEIDHMNLYVRIRDVKSQRVIATYSLGRLVPHRDPAPVIDNENRLNVLFLTGPKASRFCVVDSEGDLVKSQVYEDVAGALPRLMLSNAGRVRVDGGRLYDPNAPKPEETREVIHSLTERPPGAPEE